MGGATTELNLSEVGLGDKGAEVLGGLSTTLGPSHGLVSGVGLVGITGRQGTADAYSLAMGLVDKGSLSSVLDKTWKSQLQCSHNWYKAEAEYQSSQDDLAQTEIGRQIARLNRANDALAESKKYERFCPPEQQEALQMLTDQVKIALAEALSDNESIYMMTVPTDLAVPAGKEMVKPTPFEDQVPDKGGTEMMFQNLIPDSAHQNYSVYSDRAAVSRYCER